MTVWRRRAVVSGGVLLVVAWTRGAPHLGSLRGPDLVFRDLPDLPPFRELVSDGGISRGSAVLAGLPDVAEADPVAAIRRRGVYDDPWGALYGSSGSSAVPVAVFSDFRCPNCRVMESRLSDVVAGDPAAVRVVRHELPVFGAASVVAARAALASDLQSDAHGLRERLIRTPAVTDRAYILHLAEEIGLDRDRLDVDMASERVTAALAHSRAVADVFGFIGTPAFGIGRTVFMGTVPTSVLRSLVSAG